MSSSLQTAARRVATLQIPRTIASSAPRAAFSTGIQLQKSATEAAKDALKTVDRAVSDKLVDGINVTSNVAHKVKEVSEDILPGTKKTGAASEVSGKAKGKASELAGEAKGKTDEVVGEAKGKANELAGKAKGTAEEAQRKL